MVLFDSSKISDRATYEDPFAPPYGIRFVVVNGEVVLDTDMHGRREVSGENAIIQKVFPGRYLRKAS
jgi:N-acyl-D-aspartate/D-glutamate deacylase